MVTRLASSAGWVKAAIETLDLSSPQVPSRHTHLVGSNRVVNHKQQITGVVSDPRPRVGLPGLPWTHLRLCWACWI